MPEGPAVGLLHEDVQFETVEVQLRAGDLFVFYTDGITEAEDPSGADFGRERLAATVRSVAGQPAGTVVSAVHGAVDAFRGPGPRRRRRDRHRRPRALLDVLIFDSGADCRRRLRPLAWNQDQSNSPDRSGRRGALPQGRAGRSAGRRRVRSVAKKIIAVVGATGAQGGGLVRAILADPSGGVRGARAHARRDGEKAKALGDARRRGRGGRRRRRRRACERAFAGAHGAFCVTFFWEHFSPEKELAQARAMAQAAKDAGVKHVIWSTLEDTRKWVPARPTRACRRCRASTRCRTSTPRARRTAFFTELGVPTTFLLTSFYWDNLIHFGMGPKKGPDGKLAFTLPMGDKKLPGIAAEDIGRCAYGIFKRGREFIGKTVGIAGEHLTGAQMAAALEPGARAGGRLQRRAARGLPRLRLPGRRRPRQHVPVQARLRDGVLRRARPRRSRARSTRRCRPSRSGWPRTRTASRSARHCVQPFERLRPPKKRPPDATGRRFLASTEREGRWPMAVGALSTWRLRPRARRATTEGTGRARRPSSPPRSPP